MGELPNALERREYLYGEPKRKPKYETLGDDYAAAGNFSDAVECYEKLEASKRDAKLKSLRSDAMKEGNYFLLNRIDAHLPLEPSEWHEAARKAQAGGRLLYAYKAAQKSEDEALVDATREALGIAKPQAPEAFVDYLTSGEGQVEAEGDESEAAEAGDDPPQGDPEGDEAVG